LGVVFPPSIFRTGRNMPAETYTDGSLYQTGFLFFPSLVTHTNIKRVELWLKG
jgi:hypothetical protein